MSSSSKKTIWLIIPFFTALTACNVQPLHGTSAAATQTAALLADIDLVPPDSRVEQVLQNELVFHLSRGGQGGNRYTLDLRTASTAQSVLVQSIGGKPQARFVRVETNYQLTDSASGAVVDSGRLFREASFDWSEQRFANVRAEQDAEDRAARALADDLYAALAGFFAANR